jgi:hypothetical protein
MLFEALAAHKKIFRLVIYPLRVQNREKGGQRPLERGAETEFTGAGLCAVKLAI